MGNRTVIIVVIILVVLCCCAALTATVVGGLAFWNIRRNVSPGAIPTFEFQVPTVDLQLPTLDIQIPNLDQVTPTPEPPGEATPTPDASSEGTPTPEPQINHTPVANETYNTLDTLEKAVVPTSDPRELAQELQGTGPIAATVPAPSAPWKLGDTQKYWVTNVDTNATFQVTTVLRYIGQNLYFWIEDGVDYSADDLKKLCDTFDAKIYPTDRKFFGSEWKPGVDNDPRLYIVYAKGLGSSLAGYYSSADENPPQAHKYSNAHEMFLLNSDIIRLNESFTYGVLAHEFQHMIHWYADRNEDTWMNEGFSELAAFLNGYTAGGFDTEFIMNPDLQLNDWPTDPGSRTPHYGAAFLYLTYFLDRFGENATKSLVANPDNGMDSVDGTLGKLNVVNSKTGKVFTADDIYADWAVTNYLLDGSVADGRYTYKNYKEAPQATETESFGKCPIDLQSRTVHQYGTDYIKLACNGPVTLKFTGSTDVGVIAEDPHSGKYALWSNKGDESDMTLTQSFDFSGVSAPVTFSYWTWYDLEKDYDFLYLEASLDGSNWKILKTPSCSEGNKSGNNYGCGYNNTSSGWMNESVDLSGYAGKKVQLRFEYITDAAVNGEGLLLDDLSIPAIHYSTDLENDNGGWQANGFVRIQNRLPQTYRVSLIKEGSKTSVDYVNLDANESASIPLDFGKDLKDVILVVSGSTRFTRQEAGYQFQVK